MSKITKRIEIVSSANRRLSSMGPDSRAGTLAVLSKYYSDVRITLINRLADLEALVSRRPDLVFLGMNYIPTDPNQGPDDSDKIWISGYLDEHAIVYTGSSQPAHQLDNHKPSAKQRALDSDLATSPYFVAHQHTMPTRADITFAYPMFIKPTDLGGGKGIDSESVVHDFDQMRAKISSITAELGSDSLIEQYLPGREFSVAILKDEYSERYSVMPIELIAPPDKLGNRILSALVKHEDSERFVEVTDKTIKTKVADLALDIFHALEARDYGRIDIRLDSSGAPHFLEANLIPSLLDGFGNFPKACLLNIKLGYEPMILSIVRLALARSLDLIQPIADDDLVLPALEPVLEV